MLLVIGIFIFAFLFLPIRVWGFALLLLGAALIFGASVLGLGTVLTLISAVSGG